MKRYLLALTLAMSFTAALYIAVAVLGYIAFGNYIQGDMLKNFGSNWALCGCSPVIAG